VNGDRNLALFCDFENIALGAREARYASFDMRAAATLGRRQTFRDGWRQLLVDCAITEIPDPAALEARLSTIIGVVENSLFIGMASKIVVGGQLAWK
jgi:ribose 5-phosphate isomerase